jgi:hypothetical protein
VQPDRGLDVGVAQVEDRRELHVDLKDGPFANWGCPGKADVFMQAAGVLG